jgi:hypothetical protein
LLPAGNGAVWGDFTSGDGNGFRVQRADTTNSTTDIYGDFWRLRFVLPGESTPTVLEPEKFSLDETVVGNVLTGTPVQFDLTNPGESLFVSQQFTLFKKESTIRILVTFRNNSASDIILPVSMSGTFQTNTQSTEATSDDGNSFTTTDRWLITSDSNGGPVHTFVSGGPGSVVERPTGQVFSAGAGAVASRFNITIPRNRTRSLMFFGLLNDNVADALKRTQRLNNPLQTEQAGLLKGLTQQQRYEVLNWDLRPPLSVAGADAGGAPIVQIIDGVGNVRSLFYAYEGGFRGGVRVALGDVNGDGVPDIITAPGQGRTTVIRVYNADTGKLQYSFTPFEANYTGGAFVAAGDVNGDGVADIIVGSGANRTQEVRVFDGRKRETDGSQTQMVTLSADLLGYPGANGVHVAAGDVDGVTAADRGTPTAEIITAPGSGIMNPTVKVFQTSVGANNVVEKTPTQLTELTFNPYPSSSAGAYITAGNLDGDARGIAEILTINGDGPVLVKIFQPDQSPPGADPTNGFPVYEAPFRRGGRIAMTDVNRDGRPDLIIGMGPGLYPSVNYMDVKFDALNNGYRASLLKGIYPFVSHFLGGIFVAGNATR